ncbi:sensor histidine kinase [Kribbella sp. NPDC026611]|uniref:sensor histidine kinase n=1 Tax=Kribbella sp. NPDC026611 TaxID=3154911 RepID=UPI0033E882B4
MSSVELRTAAAAEAEAAPAVRAWVRPGPTAKERRYDVLLGLGMALAAVFGTELARGGSATHVDLGIGGVEPYVLSAAGALPLCFRRRFPIPVMLVVAALFVVTGERALFAFSANLVTQISLFMSIFAAVAWGRDRRLVKAACGLVFLVMFGWLTINFVQALRANAIEGPNHGLFSPYVSNVIITVALNGLYFFGAYFWGRTAWATARQQLELAQQASELATQQEANARRAVIDERLRISRELHDVVAHHISSIGVQAGGARRVMDTDPDAAKNALNVIEESSRSAVNEMRQLLGMLRAADPDLDVTAEVKAPQAGADRLPALIAEVNGLGLEVGFHQIGAPVELPKTVSVSVYRIAQEALSNVRKHSTARSAHLTLRYLEESVELEVLDDGRPKHAPVGSRLGHVGIRERVGLLGGESEIGPRPVGGFRVRVRLPLDPQNRPLSGGQG